MQCHWLVDSCKVIVWLCEALQSYVIDQYLCAINISHDQSLVLWQHQLRNLSLPQFKPPGREDYWLYFQQVKLSPMRFCSRLCRHDYLVLQATLFAKGVACETIYFPFTNTDITTILAIWSVRQPDSHLNTGARQYTTWSWNLISDSILSKNSYTCALSYSRNYHVRLSELIATLHLVQQWPPTWEF